MEFENSNVFLYKHSEGLAQNIRIVKSKRKEKALNGSNYIPFGGIMVIVMYGSVRYLKITDGQRKFSELPHISDGSDGKTPSFADITGSPHDNASLDTILKGLVSKAGDIITGQLLFEDPNNRSKIILTKYKDGTGHKNAPTELDINSIYLHLGGTEYAPNSYRLIGFGYRHSLDSSHAPVVIGFQETNVDGSDMGRFIIATRNVNTDTAPTIRFTVEPNGDIKALDGAKFVGDGSALENLTLPSPTDDTKGGVIQQPAIADLTEAPTMEDYNALLSALRASGVIAS